MSERRLHPFVRWVTEHALVPLALRAAGAAMLAWAIVLPFGGLADDYAYYAPLGAVVSVSTTVTHTIRAAGQAFLALVLGAVLGVGADLSPLPEVLALGLVIALGTLISGWKALGTLTGWVPIAALFILILGGTEPMPYAAAYIGFTTLGALVGVGVNTAFPPLSFAETRLAQESLRHALVAQLEELADVLEGDTLPTREEWQHRRRALEPRARRVRQLVARVGEGPQVNWRAWRWRRLAEEQQRHGRALVNLAFLVEDMTGFLAGHERAELEQVALGHTLRPSAAHALRATATVLGSVDGDAAGAPEMRRAERAVEGFGAAIRSLRRRTDHDQFEAGTLLTGIRRLLQSVPVGNAASG